MTLEEIYYVGQTIAVVAILGSLGAIWVQMRKDHLLARNDNQREILEQASHLFDELLASPTGLESLEQCSFDYHAASVRQKTEFAQFMLKHMMLAEQSNYMTADQLISGNSHQKFVNLAAIYLGSPGGRQYWVDSKTAFGDDVVAAVDRALSENPIPLAEAVRIMPHIGDKVRLALQKEPGA